MSINSVQVDLHLHSDHSDGRMDPDSLVRLCDKKGLKVISLTDHDTTSGLHEAKKTCRDLNIGFIPGIELGTVLNGQDIHILGYHVDESDSEFQSVLSHIREERIERGIKIVEKLVALGIPVSLDRVLEIADDASLGRPHIAYALVEIGVTRHPKEAFDKFIGSGSPAYVPRKVTTPFEAIDIINRNGALPVLAHPMHSNAKSGREGIKGLNNILPEMKKKGLIGMEVHYGDYSAEQINRLKLLTKKYGLIECGGSDFHAAGNPVEIKPGEVGPSLDVVDQLKHQLDKRNGN